MCVCVCVCTCVLQNVHKLSMDMVGWGSRWSPLPGGPPPGENTAGNSGDTAGGKAPCSLVCIGGKCVPGHGRYGATIPPPSSGGPLLCDINDGWCCCWGDINWCGWVGGKFCCSCCCRCWHGTIGLSAIGHNCCGVCWWWCTCWWWWCCIIGELQGILMSCWMGERQDSLPIKQRNFDWIYYNFFSLTHSETIICF